MNAQKYILGLAAAVDGNGSFVHEHSDVIGIHEGSPTHISTKHAKVMARDIVIATSVPTFPLAARGGYGLLEYPTESFLVAGPLKHPLTGMYISPDPGHYSLLPILVGGKSVLLVGGEGGNIPGLRSDKTAKYQRLASYAQRWFNVSSITHQWGDRDYQAYDDIPLIGKLYPWSRHLYVGTGFKKWGMTGGTVAGMILCDLLTDQPNVWAGTFSSTRRSPITSMPRAIIKYLTR